MISSFTLSACGQTSKSDKILKQRSSISNDTTTIFRNISLEICNCTFSTMKNNKPTTSVDSCYKAVLSKYKDSLKQLGVDPATPAGELKLFNEVFLNIYNHCPGLSKIIQKENEDENAKKLLFKGELVSQSKLPSGFYEIVMKNMKSNESKVFYAKRPLDETQIKKFEPGYELTIEYEVIKNKKTNKDEYYLKEFGIQSGVGAVKVTTQK